MLIALRGILLSGASSMKSLHKYALNLYFSSPRINVSKAELTANFIESSNVSIIGIGLNYLFYKLEI
jgi:hypothetical protein